MKTISLLTILILIAKFSFAQLPSSFDLRNVEGNNYVTSMKNSLGGTSWAFSSLASMESNLLMSGNWDANGETGEPNLAEYHLDWWNGFNDFNNDDISVQGGDIALHIGGNYLMTAAYIARGEGTVRDIDGQSYSTAPERYNVNFHNYYARDIEWYTIKDDISDIDTIKIKLMENGGIATSICFDDSFIDISNNHFQPESSNLSPNHGVTIIGWDDNRVTQATLDGAWLAKNSWGDFWGDAGYFWISYYDKYAGKEKTTGAVSFLNVESLQYSVIYSHDFHGKADTKEDSDSAFNAFNARETTWLKAVSFYTDTMNVSYTVKIHSTFNGALTDVRSIQEGTITHRGFHTIDLDMPVSLQNNDDFYISLHLSAGGQAYDRTTSHPFLLGGATQNSTVISIANLEESFYFENGEWKDLYDYIDPSGYHRTGNFCIKGLAEETPPNSFGVIFSIKSLSTGLPIENISIEFNSLSKTTNESGESVFLDVADNTLLSYTIPTNGVYLEAYGTITLSSDSHTEEIWLDDFVSIEKLRKSNFDISPNPAGDFIVIKSEFQNKESSFDIVDISGRTVQSGILKQQNSTINISTLNDGLYLLVVDGESRKFVISKQ